MAKKNHAGFRFSARLIAALDAAADAQGVNRTALVEKWLEQRALAEGWMETADAMADDS